MIITIKPLNKAYEAIQFNGANVNECLAFIGEQPTKTNPYWGLFKVGQVNAEIGDYIVKYPTRYGVIPKEAFEEEMETVKKGGK